MTPRTSASASGWSGEGGADARLGAAQHVVDGGGVAVGDHRVGGVEEAREHVGDGAGLGRLAGGAGALGGHRPGKSRQ